MFHKTLICRRIAAGAEESFEVTLMEAGGRRSGVGMRVVGMGGVVGVEMKSGMVK